MTSLTRYILSHKSHTQQEQSDFTILFSQIAMACKVTANAIRRAGFDHNFGLAGCVNVQGEEVKKLDLVANTAFVSALTNSEQVAVMASEEEEGAIIVEIGKRGKYIVCFDPLDGSSNIDANVSIGSIFAIYKRADAECDSEPSVADCLKPGKLMVASGYALYGSSTMLVCTTGFGVQGMQAL
jgi:fructose-1,6-bisphosphatase I